MKHLAPALLAAFAPAAWCAGAAAAETPPSGPALILYEYRGEASEPGFWWARSAQEATVQFTNWTRVSTSARPENIPGFSPRTMERFDRPFFIGNVIENLRGLDPAFAVRDRALNRAGGQSTLPQPAAPRSESANGASAPAALVPRDISSYMPTVRSEGASTPPAPVELPDDVWLQKQDGSIIRPLRRTAIAGDQQYCVDGDCETSYVYAFPLPAVTEAVALVFTRNGEVSTRSLDSLAGLPQ